MTPKAFRALCLSMSESHEEPHFERVSFRVAKKIFATMTPDGEEAMVRATPDGALALIEGSPDVFFSYGGFTTRNGSLGVHLARASAPVLTELVTMAWRSVAPKRLLAGSPATTAPGQVETAKTDPRVDALIAKAPAYAKPVLTHLRALVHEAIPDATEDIKWARPFFLVGGAIVCNMAAFKAHCAFGFWAPQMNALLAAEGVAGEGGPNGGSSLGKITRLEDLPPRRTMLGYLRKAAELQRTGVATSPAAKKAGAAPRPPIPVPDDFAAALARSKKASRVFETFSPSCRREYLEWVTTAKRAETRKKRVDEAVARIAQGLERNEEYRR
jgi:uncharacterized protein YdeI (YjbR/CyaY-like superfamily)